MTEYYTENYSSKSPSSERHPCCGDKLPVEELGLLSNCFKYSNSGGNCPPFDMESKNSINFSHIKCYKRHYVVQISPPLQVSSVQLEINF